MTEPESEQRLAFAEAIHALNAEPTAENVVRYLVASRNLERPPASNRSRKSREVSTTSA